LRAWAILNKMSDFKTRLVEEKKQLEDKTLKLASFTGTTTFEELDFDNQMLLRAQLNAMNAYLDILILRIEKVGA